MSQSASIFCVHKIKQTNKPKTKIRTLLALYVRNLDTTRWLCDYWTSHAQINWWVLSSLQGLSATSPEVGTTVLPGVPGANPHRPACPESGLCNAGVHTVWVCIHKDALIRTLLIDTSPLYFRGKMYSVTILDLICLVFSSSGVRPFGVSLLIAGWDEDHPYLFQSDPSVCCFTNFQICWKTIFYCALFSSKINNWFIFINLWQQTNPALLWQ